MLAIIDIASVDFQDTREDRRVILRVSNESDISKVKLASFFYSNFNIDELAIEGI